MNESKMEEERRRGKEEREIIKGTKYQRQKHKEWRRRRRKDIKSRRGGRQERVNIEKTTEGKKGKKHGKIKIKQYRQSKTRTKQKDRRGTRGPQHFTSRR